MTELLVLGAEGSGKSLLIRKLKQLCSDSGEDEDQSESTIPTVGVDISSVQIEGLELDIREIGASMATRWSSYIPDCQALLFVIDASDLGILASNLVLLYEVQAHRQALQDIPFAILFNKIDLVGDRNSIATIYNILRIDDLLQNEHNGGLVLLSGSSLQRESAPFCVRAWAQTFILRQNGTT